MPTTHYEIDPETGEEVVRTVNGVPSISHRFAGLSVDPNYEDHWLPSGFNIGLAQQVLRHIIDHAELWMQGTWRSVAIPDTQGEWSILDNSPLSALMTMDEALAAENADPRCATAMCFAGWVTEYSEAHWVLDSKTWKRMRKERVPINANLEHHLFVRKDSPLLAHSLATQAAALGITPEQAHEAMVPFFSRANWVNIETSALLADLVAARGFDKERYYVLAAGDYAYLRLGLLRWRYIANSHTLGGPALFVDPVETDPLELFEGDNTLPHLRWIIERYAEHGPAVPKEDVEDWQDSGKSRMSDEDYLGETYTSDQALGLATL